MPVENVLKDATVRAAIAAAFALRFALPCKGHIHQRGYIWFDKVLLFILQFEVFCILIPKKKKIHLQGVLKSQLCIFIFLVCFFAFRLGGTSLWLIVRWVFTWRMRNGNEGMMAAKLQQPATCNFLTSNSYLQQLQHSIYMPLATC